MVSTYLIQNATWWIDETSADGLRLDIFPYVGRQFWYDFHHQLFTAYPNLTTVGEVLNETYLLPPAVNAFFAGGSHIGATQQVDTGLYTPFDSPLYGVLRNVLLHGAPMTDLDLLLRQDSLYPHPERLVTLLGSHDTSRFLNEKGATPEELALAFGILSTVRGTPVIYSGDEVGMLGGQDPDNRHDFPGGFPANAGISNAFSASTRTPAQSFLHDRVKELLGVRRACAELSSGDQQELEADGDTLAYVRGFDLKTGCAEGHGRALILVNKGAVPHEITVQAAQSSLAQFTSVSTLFGDSSSVTLKDGRLQAKIPAVGMLILRLQQTERVCS